jgi:hypothetical protein
MDGQLTWRAAPGQSLTVGLSRHLQEDASSTSYAADVSRTTTRWPGLCRRLRAVEPAGRMAARRQLGLRRRGHRPHRRRLGAGRVGCACAALLGTTFRAPSFNDLYFPGYGVPTVGPERGRSVELGLDWRGSMRRRRADGLPQPRARPDRLRARPQLVPTGARLRLRLCAQHRPRPLQGATLTGGAVGMRCRCAARPTSWTPPTAPPAAG